MLSVAWSLSVVLLLTFLERYTFGRLLMANAGVCLVALAAGRTRLAYRGSAPAPTWTIALPLLLVLLGLWRFFPTSEYIIGGKDPGTYVNAGVQMAQRGTMAIHDATAAAVPGGVRNLFFPWHGHAEYYSTRFLGFNLIDPDRGTVMPQFPHLFPASIAIGYGLDGLRGGRNAVAFWGVLGLLAVYFAGARVFGRPAAVVASALLALNAAEIFFARYPNSELAMQTLIFAALLACGRMYEDEIDWFGPLSAWLAGLLLFLRIDAPLALLPLVAAVALQWMVNRRRPNLAFVAALAVTCVLGTKYLFGPMAVYTSVVKLYFTRVPVIWIAAGSAAAAGAIALTLRRIPQARARAVIAWSVVILLIAAAGYAWFLRVPLRAADSKLAEHDATALRVYTDFYLSRPLLVAALAGLVLSARQTFWRAPALMLTLAAFSLSVFYKIHVVPEHFWAARRLLPVVLPGALLLGAWAAFGDLSRWRGALGRARAIAGLLVIGWIGWTYAVQAAPIAAHVEYRDMVAYIERLAAQFSDRDLVLVESRDAGSDVHVMAVPLEYIYAKHVLLLSNARPDKQLLLGFLNDAVARYDRIFFLGGGGTDLLTRQIVATPVSSEEIQIDEYQTTPWHEYPQQIRRKEFDYGIYRLTLDGMPAGPFSLDVGTRDDLHVVRFGAKETVDGRSVRWTGVQSFVAVSGLSGAEREVVIVMSNGGRPPSLPPARVEVSFNDVPLGAVVVGADFAPYRFALPADAAARAGSESQPAQLKLVTNVWNPQKAMGGFDNRNLGVMVDRVDVR